MTAEYDASYTSRQTNRSWLRKRIRRAYLAKAAGLVRGPTLDFGCGVGELLKVLPPGSAGLEYNRSTVEHCRRSGLPVEWYDGFDDDWGLRTPIPGSGFESMVISHVLEHLDEPLDVFVKLLRSARRLGIRLVLVIVPGPAGFKIDPTHRTFVDKELLSSQRVEHETGFRAVHSGYFPLDVKAIGNWFPYHELQVVYEARG